MGRQVGRLLQTAAQKIISKVDLFGPKNDWFETHTAACLEVVIFYTEILSGRVVLWSFFSSETSEKSTIQLFKSKSQYRM